MDFNFYITRVLDLIPVKSQSVVIVMTHDRIQSVAADVTGLDIRCNWDCLQWNQFEMFHNPTKVKSIQGFNSTFDL